MNESNEVLITSDANGQLWNSCIWDFVTGTSLRVFKGGTSATKTMALIGSEYIISADGKKPLLNYWMFTKKDQQQQKMVCPGLVTALTMTPDGTYCIGAIGEKIFIWQVSTGELLTVISRHYQIISCLKVTDDGSFLISSGEDCLVLVWKLGRKLGTLLSSLSNSAVAQDTPHYIWSNHSLPITDIHLGKGGRRTRVVTASLDHTCRLYSLRTGELLLTVIFEVGITSVSMDGAEVHIFAGGTNGNIFQVNLFDHPNVQDHHFSSNEETNNNVFKGHEKQVTNLAVSMDGLTLISGSNDHTVKVWNIPSHQCLRTLVHHGPITNIMLIPTYVTLSSMSKGRPFINIQQFRSYLCGSDSLDGDWQHSACVSFNSIPKYNFEDTFEFSQKLQYETNTDIYKLETEIEELKKVNYHLCQKTIKGVLESK